MKKAKKVKKVKKDDLKKIKGGEGQRLQSNKLGMTEALCGVNKRTKPGY
jgi:hypothetical protein